MRTLSITLKRKWFGQIKAKTKLHEYREIKGYWVSRLITSDSKDFEPEKITDDIINLYNSGYTDLDTILYMIKAKESYYALVKAKNGYNPTSPVITWRHEGLKIGLPNPDWCEPEDIGKLVFILEIGDVI